jgi:hypothetical protein
MEALGRPPISEFHAFDGRIISRRRAFDTLFFM